MWSSQQSPKMFQRECLWNFSPLVLLFAKGRFVSLKNVWINSVAFIINIMLGLTSIHNAVMAEWLRRWTWNPMGSSRVGSNPTHSEFFCSNFIVKEALNPQIQMHEICKSLIQGLWGPDTFGGIQTNDAKIIGVSARARTGDLSRVRRTW